MLYSVRLRGFNFVVHTWQDGSRRLEPEYESARNPDGSFDDLHKKHSIVSTQTLEEVWQIEAASPYEVRDRFKQAMGIRSCDDVDRDGRDRWEISVVEPETDETESTTTRRRVKQRV